MCETKAVLVSLSSTLLVTASLCKNRAHIEKSGGHNEMKTQNPCESEYKKYWLKGGECYYLVDENIPGCKGPLL